MLLKWIQLAYTRTVTLSADRVVRNPVLFHTKWTQSLTKLTVGLFQVRFADNTVAILVNAAECLEQRERSSTSTHPLESFLYCYTRQPPQIVPCPKGTIHATWTPVPLISACVDQFHSWKRDGLTQAFLWGICFTDEIRFRSSI